MKAPSQYEAEARYAMAHGQWGVAAEQWYLARAASVGHNRRARYETMAKRCEDAQERLRREVDRGTE